MNESNFYIDGARAAGISAESLTDTQKLVQQLPADSRAVVYGSPGSGKTTALRALYLARIKGKGSDDDDEANGNKGGGAGRDPDNDEFIEDAAGDRRGGNRRSAKGDDDSKDESPDKVLSDAVAEQKAFRSSRFAAPQRGSK